MSGAVLPQLDAILLLASVGNMFVPCALNSTTGIVWDTDGHIVTNYHVLANVLKGLGQGVCLSSSTRLCHMLPGKQCHLPGDFDRMVHSRKRAAAEDLFRSHCSTYWFDLCSAAAQRLAGLESPVTTVYILLHVSGGTGAEKKEPTVARVTLLGVDGVQQTYAATLVGTDRNRDLVVVCAA